MWACLGCYSLHSHHGSQPEVMAPGGGKWGQCRGSPFLGECVVSGVVVLTGGFI